MESIWTIKLTRHGWSVEFDDIACVGDVVNNRYMGRHSENHISINIWNLHSTVSSGLDQNIRDVFCIINKIS